MNWILQGLTLRVTLDTDIVRLNVIQARRIHDVGSRRFAGVLAAWAMAFLAPHVLLGDGFRLDVVIDGMAAVTSRPSRAPGVGTIGVESKLGKGVDVLDWRPVGSGEESPCAVIWN